MTDIRRMLLAAFEVEHRDHLDAIRRALASDGALDMREIFRRAHSLKGAARAVDLPAVEALAHQLEEMFSGGLDGGEAFDRSKLEAIHQTLDEIEALSAPVSSDGGGARVEEDAAARGGELLRVDVEELALLTGAAHQVSTALADQERSARRLRQLETEATRMEQLWRDLRPRADSGREALKAREMDEALRALGRELRQLRQDQARAIWSADQGAQRVREQAERIAMTPADAVLGTLPGMVRQLARETGAAVEVEVSGLETRAERRVLQALKDPLVHLLRNALSHGGEPIDQRRRAGKPEALRIGLSIAARGGRLEIRVTDDGPGPDLAKLEAAAVARGALAARPADSAPPSEEELMSLAFEAGVSSASNVDPLSGRGMGLSVVAEAVRALGGSVRLTAAKPHGAEVVINAPLTTSRRALAQLEADGAIFALPADAGLRLLRLRATELETVDGRPVARIEFGGKSVVAPIVPLTALISNRASAVPVHQGAVHVALVARGDRRLAVAVDATSDVAAAVVETIALSGVDPALTLGATILGDETPVIVLNPDALLDRWLRDHRHLAASGLGLVEQQEAEERTARTVLVVDDSITTRTLEKSILEAQGYRVVLAVDGLDALNTLRSGEAMIDLVVADIEMPRMDGFSLLQAIKADAALAALPVILMTSRADPQDVRRGLDLGAEAYITKQKFDQRELLATIGRVL